MIQNIDCLEFMRGMVERGERVDAIISDPPYGIGYKTNHRNNKSHKFCSEIANDDDLSFLDDFLEISQKILNDNSPIYVFCSWHKVDIFKQKIERFFKIKNMLIWDKENWTAGDLLGAYAGRYEILFFATKGRVLLNGRRDSDILRVARVSSDKLLHQNEKPISLLTWILRKHPNAKTIFDPFMGSGSTGVASLIEGRKFLGCEIDTEYFEIAKRRIEATDKTLRRSLFYGID